MMSRAAKQCSGYVCGRRNSSILASSLLVGPEKGAGRRGECGWQKCIMLIKENTGANDNDYSGTNDNENSGEGGVPDVNDGFDMG